MKKQLFRQVVLMCMLVVSASSVGEPCQKNESTVFQCGLKVGSVSVCASKDDRLSFRLWEGDALQEIQSPVHYSQIGFSGGGEANLTFERGALKFVVYTKILKGERLADGTPELIERAGVYIVKKQTVIQKRACVEYPMGNTFGDLPPYEEEVFEFYQ